MSDRPRFCRHARVRFCDNEDQDANHRGIGTVVSIVVDAFGCPEYEVAHRHFDDGRYFSGAGWYAESDLLPVGETEAKP